MGAALEELYEGPDIFEEVGGLVEDFDPEGGFYEI